MTSTNLDFKIITPKISAENKIFLNLLKRIERSTRIVEVFIQVILIMFFTVYTEWYYGGALTTILCVCYNIWYDNKEDNKIIKYFKEIELKEELI